MTKEYDNIQQLWAAMKAQGLRSMPLWRDISAITGIGLDVNNIFTNNKSREGRPLDQFVDDPTSAISVNQAGDYLLGIMYGTGEDVFDIEPSEEVAELATDAELAPWYKWATSRVLYHMNHPDAGLQTALRPYAYDQVAFGTSGVGAFPNLNYGDGGSNLIVFRQYGVDNTRIDEGENGLVEYVGTVYHWKVNRIVGTFCKKGGVIDDTLVSNLPKQIREAYKKGNYNDRFHIVCVICPNGDYSPKLKGIRGARYKGVWFLDKASDNTVFHTDYYKEKPIAMARMIKLRDEVYGRSSGTMLLSTIRSVNFMVGTSIEIIEKMANPSLGVFNNAIFGDTVLDTSANGLTVFNTAAQDAKQPLFPLYDVGDPSKILGFLVPYLNEKIASAFKIDLLLDFSSAKEMSATESLQRYAIRGKSLAGMLLQQKIELLEPLARRSISICMDADELGVDPTLQELRAKALYDRGKTERVIPQAVVDVIRSGKPWYKIKWNNELEKVVRTEAVQNLLQVIQAIGAAASMYPDIIQAVNWYKLIAEINENLDCNNQLLISEDEFKAMMQQKADMQAQALQLQAGQVGATMQKDMSQANKNNQEARNARTGSQ